MKRLLPTKTILFATLCFALTTSLAHAKTMYKWVDEKGKVSFSDQVPPAKAVLKHEELDSNAKLIKVNAGIKTKAELEIEKRLALQKKQQEDSIAKQKAYDKQLLSGFIDLNSMESLNKTKMAALDNQEKAKQETIKKLEEELVSQQKNAASYEIKNTKIPADLSTKITATQAKIATAKQELAQLQTKKVDSQKEFSRDRARYLVLTHAKTSTPDATATQAGIFSCDNKEQCEKAWAVAKEFVKANSVAKISVDTDTSFISVDPVADTDLNLSLSKMVVEGSKSQIFLDLRCTETVAGKALCASPKAEEMKTQFNDYLNTKLNATAPVTPKK